MSSGRPDFHPAMLLEGKYGTNLVPVLVDAYGQLFAVMKGAYGTTLKTIATDSNGVMLANLSAQDLDFLRVRPTYGQGRFYGSGWIVVPNVTLTTIITIAGRGAILGGFLSYEDGLVPDAQNWYVLTDGAAFAQDTPDSAYNNGQIMDLDYPLSVSRFDTLNNIYRLQLGKGITFESSFVIKTYHNYGGAKNANAVLYYALKPV